MFFSSVIYWSFEFVRDTPNLFPTDKTPFNSLPSVIKKPKHTSNHHSYSHSSLCVGCQKNPKPKTKTSQRFQLNPAFVCSIPHQSMKHTSNHHSYNRSSLCVGCQLNPKPKTNRSQRFQLNPAFVCSIAWLSLGLE